MVREKGKWVDAKVFVPRGGKLSPSKKVDGAFSPLVHKGKGVKSQTVIKFPKRGSGKVDSSRGFKSFVVSLLSKALIWVAVAVTVVTIAALIISAIVAGISAGFVKIGDAIAVASEYLAIGAGVVALGLVSAVGIRTARLLWRRSAEKSADREARLESSATSAQSAAPRKASESVRTSHAEPKATPADWYLDPSNASMLRYWSGSAWTHHIAPRHDVPARPVADWYPDRSNPDFLRYWDGSAWTHHTSARQRNTTPAARTPTPSEEPGLTMTSDEWQNRVRVWLAAQAAGDELWDSISRAQIKDADPIITEWQNEMRKFTPEQLAHRVRLMLDANPSLRDELPLTEFLRLLGLDRPVGSPEERIHIRKSRKASGGYEGR